MVRSFKCNDTERLADDIRLARFFSIEWAAQRKLEMLNAAINLEDLRLPQANRLEKLKGGRLGQYSIRINGQWRLCFEWANGNVWNVEIVDFH